MKRSRSSRVLSGMLAFLMLTGTTPILAQETDTPPVFDPDQVRHLLEIEKDYEAGQAILNRVIEDEGASILSKQQAYILLVEMYVLRANDFEGEDEDQNAADMRSLARAEIRNCLGQTELRHARPDSSEHPDVIDFFAQERSKMFGSFTVSSLIPPHAVVVLDTVTLASSANGFPGEESVYPGPKTIKVTAEGYSPIIEQVDFLAGQHVVRPFKLEKKKGWKRYLFPGAALAGVVGLVMGLSGSGDPAEEPLPGPPAPPGQ